MPDNHSNQGAATYMNPYWFVPMDGDAAQARTLSEWGVYDEQTRTRPRGGSQLLTGRIEVTLEAITPIHIGGAIDASRGGAMRTRHFYRRVRPGDAVTTPRPVVEGSSLRGMIRSYIEALTNGVASSYISKYEKQKDKRHIGFWVGREPNRDQKSFKDYQETFLVPGGRRHLYGDSQGVQRCDQPLHVFPEASLGDRQVSDLAPKVGGTPVRVDPATLMFGLVTPEGDTEEARRARQDRARKGLPVPVPAIASRMRFEDAWFAEDQLERDRYKSLDLDGKAILGGGKPSKSSWWYFKPFEIRRRNLVMGSGTRSMAEFVGGQLRGRKFYFHQDPEQCVGWYLKNWPQRDKLVPVATECVRPGARSSSFWIHFEELPEPLLKLLLVALSPSCQVRHKLGALRPFGFGSVALHVSQVRLERPGVDGLDFSAIDTTTDDGLIPAGAELMKFLAHGENESFTDQQERREYSISAAPNSYLVDATAWTYLRLMGYCPAAAGLGEKKRLFVYPCFTQPPRGTRIPDLERGFAFPVQEQDVTRTSGLKLPVRDLGAQEKALNGLGEATKKAIDLEWYQTHASNFKDVYAEALQK